MEKVKQFIDTVFEKEVIALGMQFKKGKVAEFNTYIETELNTHCVSFYDEEWDEEIPFNLLGKMMPNLPEVFYKNKDAQEKNIRYIFKISEYPHARYGKIWTCYVSGTNPNAEIKSIFNCFIVAEIEGTYKFISKMTADPDTKKWGHSSGDTGADLRLGKLKNPTKIERYTEPVSRDEWNLKEYLKDK